MRLETILTAHNRRSDVRMGIALPVRVRGHDPAGAAWHEMTKCEDASTGGASFLLQHEALTGQVLYLSLPLPRRFRRYDPTAATYHVYALVKTARNGPKGCRVGVLFLGKTPPAGYHKEPGARFLTERRKKRRGPLFLKLKIQHHTAEGGVRAHDHGRTVLENFGSGGAQVMTALTITEGEIVTVEDVEGSFRARAEVRGSYVGKDGIRRLNLRFLDRG